MATTQDRLVIGNKNTSSWSLRPWLAMKRFSIPFEEIAINLRAEDRKQQIFKYSPSGKVPALSLANGPVIWDSLAILEYLADKHPDKPFWPKDIEARGIARCVSAEMHSGFHALRELMPMDFMSHQPVPVSNETLKLNIQRVVKLWLDVRATYGGDGPFLFSDFSIADAMYAPVASRFKTYVNDLTLFGDDGTARAYIETLFEMPEMKEWGAAARSEIADATQ